MAGSFLTVTTTTEQASAALLELAERLGDVTTPLNDVAEYLHLSTDDRFRRKVGPDGSPWAPLAPSTLARKKRNKEKILRESGMLQDSFRHQVSNNELDFGTDRPYGAIHQFGGAIHHAARSQQVYFKAGKDGVGNRFVKKSASNFAQWVTHGARSTEMTARPYLGLSAEDELEVTEIIQSYLKGSFEGDQI